MTLDLRLKNSDYRRCPILIKNLWKDSKLMTQIKFKFKMKIKIKDMQWSSDSKVFPFISFYFPSMAFLFFPLHYFIFTPFFHNITSSSTTDCLAALPYFMIITFSFIICSERYNKNEHSGTSTYRIDVHNSEEEYTME